jgi:hypothetical protein
MLEAREGLAALLGRPVDLRLFAVRIADRFGI